MVIQISCTKFKIIANLLLLVESSKIYQFYSKMIAEWMDPVFWDHHHFYMFCLFSCLTHLFKYRIVY